MTEPRPTPTGSRLAAVCEEASPSRSGPAGEALEFGDQAAEYRALRTGCGVEDRSRREVLDLLGQDRERFLHGMVTCQVRGLAPGEGRYGFLTNAQGKILSEVVLLVLEDRLRLELPAGCGDRIRDHLSRYVIADRVELTPAPELFLLGLAGPRAEETLTELLRGGQAPQALWSHEEGELAGGPCRMVRYGGWPEPSFGLFAGEKAVVRVVRAVARGKLSEVRLAGRRALDAVRVEDGIAAFGRDYGDDHFPQEVGREDAVSYDKGCYLGQEVIARIHYRGKVNRVLRALLLEPGVAPEPPLELRAGDREVGRLTTVAESPRVGGPAGLALIHRQAAEPGTVLDLASGGRAEVAELPLPG